uniref:Dymeclin n=2 Tax=Cacopsylla melanoneura TaxID=428564 RepID=A0A8D8Y697_9HEMI
MGNSASQYSDAFTTNDYLLRFGGELRIEPTDPFWDQFLTFMIQPPSSMKEDEELTDKIKTLCNSLVTNNPSTGNFAVLLHVFIDKAETLLSSKEKPSNSTILHVHNALFVIRSVTKYLVHNSKDNTIVKQFQPVLCFDQAELDTNDDGLLETYIFTLFRITTQLALDDSTYHIHLECLNSIMVLLSCQMFTTQYTKDIVIYRIIMELKDAPEFTNVLLKWFIEQPKAPQPSGSLILGLASGFWSMLTLSSGSDSPVSSLAQQSVLILLILSNHCVSPTFANPYRDALSNLQDNLNSLYTVLCSEVRNEETTLLLYHLLHRNNAFKIFVLSRSDMELLVLPILRTIYHATDTSCHHIYMSLIILLILTEDPFFNKTIHSTILKSVPWYTERLIPEISLGGLMILVTTRTVQYNILKMRDKYLHTNCLAALANMSSQFSNLHPYVCQRVIGLFEVLAKTHSRGGQEQVNAVEEALRIVLEVINSCIYNQLIHNINLVYTLLYKRQIFEPFKKHEAFQDIIQNIDLVITYFSAKLEKEEDQSVDVNQVQSKVNIWSMSFPKALLKTFPELKFKYVEEERPEEFFIPYVWSLVIRYAPLYWNSALYKVC